MIAGLAASPMHRLRAVVHTFWKEMAKFGVIGAGAFVIDFGGFSVLFYGPLFGHLTTSRVLSGGLATLLAWVGNRFWTFRHRRNRPVHHEALLFFGVSGLGLLISTGYLNAAHNWLGWSSPAAVSLNLIIGIGIASLWRFYAYRQFVFSMEIADNLSERSEDGVGKLFPGDASPMGCDTSHSAPSAVGGP